MCCEGPPCLDPPAFVRLQAAGGSAALGLSACDFEAALACRAPLPAGLSVGEADGAEMRKLAIAIIALCLVEADAKRLVSMLELQVAHCFCECCDLAVVFKARLDFSAPFLAVAFARLAFTFAVLLHGRACAGLQERAHVCSYACHFMQCLVQRPPFCTQAGDLVPNFAVCLQEFVRIHRAEAGVSRQLLRAKIQDLFVECLESGKACAVAKCDCVAKNLLGACKPCWAEVRAIDAELWRLIEQCGAHQLRFGAKRAGSACLNDVLILLLAHAKLPWHPLDHPLRGWITGAPG